MIKAVFFDLFNTLVRFDPAPEDQQQWACRQFGIEADRYALSRGFYVAGDFFSREDARRPVSERSEREQSELWIEYEYILLRTAGIDISRDLASKIVDRYWQSERRITLFEDSFSTLDALRQMGLVVGIISNLHTTVADFCNGIDICRRVDFALSSHEVGAAKPDRVIFEEALSVSKASASEAIHVGDQYYADIIGARNAGIKPLLIDREGVLDHHDCLRIRGLEEIIHHL